MIRDPIVAHAAAMIRRGSKSFSRAAALLPARSRHAAYQLYAWCRYCDDTVDGQVLGQARVAGNAGPVDRRQTRDRATQRAALAELRRLTRSALDGAPTTDPVFAGLQRVVTGFGVPLKHPLALLDGMEMDVEGRQYATFDELVDYCWHVAGVVGVMMAYLMEASDPATLDLAGDLGIAFQLTNIARDVMDDAAAGRVYLPHDWLAEAGTPVVSVAEPAYRTAVARVVARLLARADEYYRRADRGLAPLPFRSAWAIAAARGIYADIGTLVRRRGAKAWDRRAVVPAAKKVYWMGWGLVRALAR